MTFFSIASSSVRYSLMETGSLCDFSFRKKSISMVLPGSARTEVCPGHAVGIEPHSHHHGLAADAVAPVLFPVPPDEVTLLHPGVGVRQVDGSLQGPAGGRRCQANVLAAGTPGRRADGAALLRLEHELHGERRGSGNLPLGARERVANPVDRFRQAGNLCVERAGLAQVALAEGVEEVGGERDLRVAVA